MITAIGLFAVFFHDTQLLQDLLILERIHTAVNIADHMTKMLDRNLFYRHVDHLMAHVPPVYSPCYEKYSAIPNTTIDDLGVALKDLVIAPEHAAAAECSVDYYPWVEVVGMDVLSPYVKKKTQPYVFFMIFTFFCSIE